MLLEPEDTQFEIRYQEKGSISLKKPVNCAIVNELNKTQDGNAHEESKEAATAGSKVSAAEQLRSLKLIVVVIIEKYFNIGCFIFFAERE